MKKTHTLVGCAISIAGMLPAITSAQTSAPIASGTFGGSTYEIYQDLGITWPDADAAAAALSDDSKSCYLATLTTMGEDDFVEGLRASSGVSRDEVWVGGFQDPPSSEEGDGWQWVNGEGAIPGQNPTTGTDPFANWQGGEPNDAGGSEFYLGIGLGGQPGWNDEANLGNIGGYIVECDVIEPGEDVTVFPPDIPDQPVVSVVEEVVEPGRIEQFSCVIKEPRRRRPWKGLNLISRIKRTHTPDCQALAAQLRPEYRARLRFYQRAFENPNSTDRNKKDIVVTLVRSTDLAGNPASLTAGVVISEEQAAIFNVAEPECRNTPTSVVDAGISPTTVRANVDGEQFIDRFATNSTYFCNRGRSASRYSDQLYAYPIRNSDRLIGGPGQVATEAAEFRLKIQAFRGMCTDDALLDELRNRFNAAMLLVQLGNPAQKLDGIAQLEATTLVALDAGDPMSMSEFSYAGCPEAEGEFVSRLLAITFQSHRYILFPGDGQQPYVVPAAIEDRLPPFPGD